MMGPFMEMKHFWQLAKSAFAAWSTDYAPSMGAALAYYTLFSVAPLLLIVISVAGLVFGVDAARGAILDELKGLMGSDGAHAVQALLASVNKPYQGVIATTVGTILLLVGATTVFNELQDDLDRIWHAPPHLRSSGVWALIRTRLLSFGMIMGIGFLLMVSLVISAAIAALGKWWAPMFGAWQAVAHLINFIISFGMTTAMFAMIYKIIPRVSIRWHDVWIGAMVTAFLFTVGKFVIGLYIGRTGVTSGFGAAGSIVVVLLWVYYSAQIFLFGAEFTAAFSRNFGSGRPQSGLSSPEKNPPRRQDAAAW